MRDHPSYATEGAVRGRGALAGSASGVDHDQQRSDLWGDVRGDGSDGQSWEVMKEEAQEIYSLYWRGKATQDELADEYNRSRDTIQAVVSRKERFKTKTAMIAHALGYPDEKSGATRHQYTEEQIKRAYRLAHNTDLSAPEVGKRCGGMSGASVNRIKNEKAHVEVTEEVEV